MYRHALHVSRYFPNNKRQQGSCIAHFNALTGSSNSNLNSIALQWRTRTPGVSLFAVIPRESVSIIILTWQSRSKIHSNKAAALHFNVLIDSNSTSNSNSIALQCISGLGLDLNVSICVHSMSLQNNADLCNRRAGLHAPTYVTSMLQPPS